MTLIQISNVFQSQDENWGETTTAVTNTSDIEYTMEEDLSKWQIQPRRSLDQRCQQYLGPLTSAILAIAAFFSPILMVVLPQLGVFDSNSRRLNLDCDVTCDGMLISFAFKLLILLIGTWAVIFRKPKTTLPRIFVFRALVSLLVLVNTVRLLIVELGEDDVEDTLLQTTQTISLAPRYLFCSLLKV